MKKTAKEIFQIVKQQHRKRTDFIEGNISKRIYAAPLYELKRVPLNLIDEQEWDIDEELVVTYAKKESKKDHQLFYTTKTGCIPLWMAFIE